MSQYVQLPYRQAAGVQKTRVLCNQWAELDDGPPGNRNYGAMAWEQRLLIWALTEAWMHN
ncbi:hypothetical protein GCM10011356_08080 [Kangiella profundi]|nr:hypothetical protein GCM10011356_08080 [Kangiella profundi]